MFSGAAAGALDGELCSLPDNLLRSGQLFATIIKR